MKKIVLIGHSGLLGAWIKRELADFNLVNVSSQSPDGHVVDMSSATSARHFYETEQPDIIINLAAFADVDACQANPDKAYRLNVLINKNIANYLKSHRDKWCISISTDHLYDANSELSREDQIVLKNVYALTKKAGEDVLPPEQSVILRTNFFGKSLSSKPSFTDWLLKMALQQQKMSLYKDSYFSPLHGKTLARLVRQVILNPQFGVFNLGSKNGLSKAEFALKFFSLFKDLKPLFEVIEAGSVQSRVLRPSNMRMDVTHFEKTYKVNLPDLTDEINKCREEYDAQA